MRRMLAAPILLSELLLMGCARPVAVISPTQHLPAEMWECKAEPALPEQEFGKPMANFVVDLADAGRDCRSKLAGAKAALGQ